MPTSLATVYKGWGDYQISLVRAVAPRSPEQLTWRPTPHLRTAGEIASHMINGRLDWFTRTFGAEFPALAGLVAAWKAEEAIEGKPEKLASWFEASWQIVDEALNRWTVDDLARTWPLTYQGRNYALPYQWILWRVMTHDIHHGGELAFTFGLQNIALPDLGDDFGHITPPPLAEP